jgi:hypothetical protein
VLGTAVTCIVLGSRGCAGCCPVTGGCCGRAIGCSSISLSEACCGAVHGLLAVDDDGVVGGAIRAAPHVAQKLAPGVVCAPHVLQ